MKSGIAAISANTLPVRPSGADRAWTSRARLYEAAIFLSAFLLFSIQPLAGRIVLPWFGGTPAVWSTCLLFFQCALLVGYIYGHGVACRASCRKGTRLHLLLLCCAALTLAATVWVWKTPLIPPPELRPQVSAVPVARIMAFLALSAGLPYVMLSATAPLFQHWFSRTYPDRSPYRLYALSNAGALAALLSYPLVIESFLSLRQQAWGWFASFLVFSVLCAALAVSAVEDRQSAAAEPVRRPVQVKPGRWMLCTALAACASLMLLATTNQISDVIPPMPLIWIPPLALYLISFVLCFESDRWYGRGWFQVALAAISAGVIMALNAGAALGMLPQLGILLAALFVCSMICHGEVARLRPPAGQLTAYYLSLAVGGAAGGIAGTLVAPWLFHGYWEYHVAFLLTAILSVVLAARDRDSWMRRRRAWPVSVALLLVLAVFLGMHIRTATKDARFLSRGFFGVLKVEDVSREDPANHALQLLHGTTLQGRQYQASARRREATTYLGAGSGIERAFRVARRRADSRGRGLRVGVIGMGTGTVAAYCRAGDDLRVYEINPAVVAYSSGARPVFTYLSDSTARGHTVLGDGRMVLESEPAQRFDLLVVDAFSGFAIPLHLLTREAVSLYLSHLNPESGIVVFNIANEYLDLEGQLRSQSACAHAVGAFISTDQVDGDTWIADWFLMSRNASLMEAPEIRDASRPARSGGAAQSCWTDDFTTVLRSLR